MIFQIGCGFIENSIWKFKQFTTNILNNESEVYILDESIKHSFPASHIDYCYSVLKVPQIQAKDGQSTINPKLVGDFAGVTGSIIIDGLKGEATARCGDLIANDVTLNFVIDSINGNTIPSKEEYAKRILETR